MKNNNKLLRNTHKSTKGKISVRINPNNRVNLLITISGYILILFFVFNLSIEGIFRDIPFDQEIVLTLITILAMAFLAKALLRHKKSSIYEIFYSYYLAFILLLLTFFYWITYLNNIDIGIFRLMIAVIHILVFLYSIIAIKYSNKIYFIIISYVFTALITILLFAYIYWTLSIFDLGYLQYDKCGVNDFTERSNNWFYFSSVTFYSLGYGDICPIMPLMRFISQIEVAMGAIINTVLIGFIFARLIIRSNVASKKK